MFCLMDVSGSMTEAMKDLAKRFFLLLHVFLSRRYKHVDIVFIRHTSNAQEVDEDTFFHSRETGGTIVSTALEEMMKVVRERYSPDNWNIYAAQASDGDNYTEDSDRCSQLLGGEILPRDAIFRLYRGRRRGDAPARLPLAAHRPLAHLQPDRRAAPQLRDAQGGGPDRRSSRSSMSCSPSSGSMPDGG